MIRELALFAGGGGGILGSILSGFTTRCAVEIMAAARETLLRRQMDGVIPAFPIWDNIETFDGRPWRGEIDVITGGFPCTDISSAGQGRGIAGKNSRLFFEMLRIVEEVRPRFVFAENSPQLRTRGLGAVLYGLACLGYDAQWGVLGARDLGANHCRKRMWIVASDTNRSGKRVQPVNAEMARSSSPHGLVGQPSDAEVIRGTGYTDDKSKTKPRAARPLDCGYEGRNSTDPNGEAIREQSGRGSGPHGEGPTEFGVTDWWCIPRFARVDDGGANRLDLEKAVAQLEVEGMAEKPRDRNARVVMTGNMQVPIAAAAAWDILTTSLGETQK